MAVYAAQVDRLDQGIGRIMATVRRLGIEDDTLVIFLSDNGGCAELLHEDGRQRDREWRTTRDGQPLTFGNVPGLMPGGPAHVPELRPAVGERLQHAFPPVQALGA